jgi:FkbM family methyltransferase
MIDRLIQLYAHTPEHPCKLRVFGFLCRALKRGRPLDLSVADGLRLRLDPFDHVDRALVLTDWHEPLTTRFIRQNLRRGQSAFIAGAHMGYHVINAARAVGRDGRVIACEPVPETLRRAVAHLGANDCTAQVRLLNIALGAKRGVTTMSAPPPDNTGAAHVSVDASSTIEVRVETIETLLRDAAVARLDFLLLDIEGYEIRALDGLGEFRPPLMVIECDPRLLAAAGDDPEQLIQHLHDRGYATFTLGGETVIRAAYYAEANIVAVHRDAPAPTWV